MPGASVDGVVDNGDGTYTVTVSASQGTYTLKTVQIIVDGTTVKTYTSAGSFTYTGNLSDSTQSVHVLVTDKAYYTAQSGASEIPAKSEE